MIGFAFYLAFQLFAVPPEVAVQSDEKSPLKIDVTIQSLLTIFVRIVLLVVMAGFGSMVANRGIKLFSSHGRRRAEIPKVSEESAVVDSEEVSLG